MRKPQPDAYLAAAKALGVPPEAVVFLDDTPECVEGARDGRHVRHPSSIRRPAGRRSSVPASCSVWSPSRVARRLVRMAEEAYGAQDLDAIMRLFHPDAIVALERQEGRRRVTTRSAGSTSRRSASAAAPRRDHQLSKTLRAAQGDTIGVEWDSRSIAPPTASTCEGSRGEFWTMRGDLVIEWHAYYHRVDEAAEVMERVVITGANRGLGLELARHPRARGDDGGRGCRRRRSRPSCGPHRHVHEVDIGDREVDRAASSRPCSAPSRSTCSTTTPASTLARLGVDDDARDVLQLSAEHFLGRDARSTRVGPMLLVRALLDRR